MTRPDGAGHAAVDRDGAEQGAPGNKPVSRPAAAIYLLGLPWLTKEGQQITGFRYAEIKPRNPSQMKKMEKQIENWGLSPDDVKPLTYDANGNIFEGF